MQHTVYNAWEAFNTPLEGCVNWMYLDTHDPPLVTTGMGNMIDPVELALPLNWAIDAVDHGYSITRAATRAEIMAEWTLVKQSRGLSRAGANAAKQVTKLRLSPDAVSQLINTKLEANADAIKRLPSYTAFEMWPADAQLAVLSMAWAMGPEKLEEFTHMSRSCAVMDFAAAATQCHMGGEPPPERRNAANKLAFQYAAQAYADSGDYSVLCSAVPPAELPVA